MYQEKRVSVRYSWKTCFLSNFVKFAKFWHQNRHNQSARQHLRFFFVLFHFVQRWIWNLTLTKLEFITLEKKWRFWTSKLWILLKKHFEDMKTVTKGRANQSRQNTCIPFCISFCIPNCIIIIQIDPADYLFHSQICFLQSYSYLLADYCDSQFVFFELQTIFFCSIHNSVIIGCFFPL